VAHSQFFSSFHRTGGASAWRCAVAWLRGRRESLLELCLLRLVRDPQAIDWEAVGALGLDKRLRWVGFSTPDWNFDVEAV
jgi:hypothetical protein